MFDIRCYITIGQIIFRLVINLFQITFVVCILMRTYWTHCLQLRNPSGIIENETGNSNWRWLIYLTLQWDNRPLRISSRIMRMSTKCFYIFALLVNIKKGYVNMKVCKHSMLRSSRESHRSSKFQISLPWQEIISRVAFQNLLLGSRATFDWPIGTKKFLVLLSWLVNQTLSQRNKFWNLPQMARIVLD